MQEGFIAHELGNLLDEYAGGFDRQAATDRLVQIFAPTLLEFGGAEAIRRIMGRTEYQSFEEERAEGFAALLRARVETRTQRPRPHRGLLGRMEEPLIDPFGGRRGG
ncbi:hypothetical protein [Nonomuraea sp. NPDC049709]|uniref:hypothetical protein n=1 Tax=Nonomuraea sp. NPDC049709 TaxID=3154736 RepID=UPI003428554E